MSNQVHTKHGSAKVAKLNQIIAVANGKKSRVQSGLTEIYHKLQKPALLEGIARVYRPKDEEGEQLPSESKKVQLRADQALDDAAVLLTDLFNVVAEQDYANCEAKADVKVGERKILEQVPVTHLLFLEKQLIDIATLVSKLPTLDPAEEWHYSDEADCFATLPTEKTRTKKVPRNHVKYEATKEHPAQVEVYTEDIVEGYWSTTKFSGAIPEADKNELAKRVRLLQDAVKMAREEANCHETTKVDEGKKIFAYLFESIGTQA